MSCTKVNKNTEITEALKETKTQMNKWLNEEFTSSGWREVGSYDATINSNEWLVCMRVGVNKDLVDGDTKGLYDYHFWYRANDGKWYNKHGWYKESKCVEGVLNPASTMANSSSGWEYETKDGIIYKNFYSSDTVFYAIKAN